MAAGHRRHRTVAALVRLEQRPCWLHTYGLCKYNGQPIDYTARWPNPRSFSADHRLPTSQGGLDTYDNTEASHLRCNTARHDDPIPVEANARTDTW